MDTNADTPAPKTEAEKQLIQLLTGNQVSPEFIGQLLQGKLRDSVKAVLDHQHKTYGITVDHALTPEQMVAAGGFDIIGNAILFRSVISDGPWPERGIASKKSDVQVEKVEKIDVRLDAPTEEVSSQAGLIAWAEKMGSRLLTLPEILAFAAAHPDIQRDGAVITLCYTWNSVKDHGPIPVVLGVRNGKRYIERGWDQPRFWWPGQVAKFAIAPKETK